MGNTTDSLNKLFDVSEVSKELVPLVSPEQPFSTDAEMVVYSEIPVLANTDSIQDQTDDYNYARGTMRSVLEKAKTALDGILDVADEQETPRSYEVISTLVKTISDVTKDLVNLHKTMQELKPRGEAPPPGATNIIDKAVFVGSPSDLLDQIRYPKH